MLGPSENDGSRSPVPLYVYASSIIRETLKSATHSILVIELQYPCAKSAIDCSTADRLHSDGTAVDDAMVFA